MDSLAIPRCQVPSQFGGMVNPAEGGGGEEGHPLQLNEAFRGGETTSENCRMSISRPFCCRLGLSHVGLGV